MGNIIEYNWTSVIAIIAALLSILGIVAITYFYIHENRNKFKSNKQEGIYNDSLNEDALRRIKVATDEITSDPIKRLINIVFMSLFVLSSHG